jgi:uncharacterized membrane protein
MMALVDSWASMYSHQPLLRTFVGFLHVGGLLVGGGFAIAVDRLTSLAAGHGPVRSAQLHLLRSTHGAVLAGIAALVVSGLLLLGADLDMYLYSKVFWIKMGLFGLLLVNGVWLLRAEREIGRGNTTAWTQLRASSAISLALWLATTLAGVALPNIG